jgi:PAS domain S-box-containing protein
MSSANRPLQRVPSWGYEELMAASPEPGDQVPRAVSDIVFRRIFDESGLGYGLVAPDLRFIDVNPALCTMLGYEREELLGRTYADVTHPDDASIDVELGRKVFAEEIPSYFLSKRFVTKSGEVRSVELYASAVADPEDDSLFGVAIIEDVTDRLRAEANRRLLHDILVAANEAPSPTWAFEATLELVCNHLGWSVGHAYLLNERGHLESTRVWYLGSDGEFDPFRTRSEDLRWELGHGLPGKVLKTRKPLWIADVTTWPDFVRASVNDGPAVRAGLAVPVLVGSEVTAVLEFFSTEHHEPDQGIIEVMEDVGTQLGRVVERRRATDSIERLVGERMAFIDRAAHELRSHTAPLGLLVSTLAKQEEAHGSELLRETVNALDAAVERLRELVTRLLDLSSVQQGRLRLETRDAEVSDVIAAALRETGEPPHVTVTVEVPPGLHLATDALVLERVIVNLLTNAFLHGGQDVIVAAREELGMVVIEVADDGPGIPPDLTEHVFEPFVRAGTEAEGTGLGLAISRGLVLALGASLEYRPNHPSGALFVLKHPVTAAA